MRVVTLDNVRVVECKDRRANCITQATNASRPILTLVLPRKFRQVIVRRLIATR